MFLHTAGRVSHNTGVQALVVTGNRRDEERAWFRDIVARVCRRDKENYKTYTVDAFTCKENGSTSKNRTHVYLLMKPWKNKCSQPDWIKGFVHSSLHCHTLKPATNIWWKSPVLPTAGSLLAISSWFLCQSTVRWPPVTWHSTPALGLARVINWGLGAERIWGETTKREKRILNKHCITIVSFSHEITRVHWGWLKN